MGPEVEEIGGLIDCFGASDQNQGTSVAHCEGVANQVVGGFGVYLHGGDHEDVQRFFVELHPGGQDVGRPLLQHNPHVLEAGGIQCVAQQTNGTGCHALVGIPVGQHVGAEVEGVHDADVPMMHVGSLPQRFQFALEGPIGQIDVVAFSERKFHSLVILPRSVAEFPLRIL